ncbi:MAG: CRISPR-associated RAMP protein Csx10 [Anaerolineales bacterium]
MWLKIRPQEPIIMGEVRADAQFLASKPYIPGRFLRGALAEWLKQNGRDDEEILSAVSGVWIGNFFPAADWKPLDYALPLPLSAASCKRAGGFRSRPARSGDESHGVVDLLLPQLAYHLLKEAGARFPVPFAVTCAECGDRLDTFGGFYAIYRDGEARYYLSVRPRYHAQTKVGLSRHRRAAAEGVLYTASAISPWVPQPDRHSGRVPLIFLGRVHGDLGGIAQIKEALRFVALGALHTRGYGTVQVEDAESGLPPLGQRLEGFNQALARVWKDVRELAANKGDLPESPTGLYFSVDLLSRAVFQDWGMPSLIPRLAIVGREVRPILWMTRPKTASGWSTAWGLPKPTNLAAQMGSVYVFHWDGSEQDLLPALHALETGGVGERRDESYGECLVCHPFHQEVEER